MFSRMSSRERWLASLASKPVDRLPFWPKIDGAYPRKQTGRFSGFSRRELLDYVGTDLHVGGPGGYRSRRSCTEQSVCNEGNRRVTRFTTPRGELTYIEGYDEDSCSHHPIKFSVETIQDIEILTAFFADDHPEPDADQLTEARRVLSEMGDDGICVTSIGISPLMDWLQHLAGIQNGIFFLHDRPDLVGELFREMHRVLVRRAEIIAEHHPFDVVYSVENTSTTLISPAMFREWCAPYLMEYGRIITGAGKTHGLHMCGKLKALLPDIAALPAQFVEAFTSAPVGDTSLLDGRSGMPEKCLIGGTNATLWLEPAETIIDTLERDLADLPHRRGIVVTSAGVMPPACHPDTIRRVRDWVVAQAA